MKDREKDIETEKGCHSEKDVDRKMPKLNILLTIDLYDEDQLVVIVVPVIPVCWSIVFGTVGSIVYLICLRKRHKQNRTEPTTTTAVKMKSQRVVSLPPHATTSAPLGILITKYTHFDKIQIK